MLNQIPDEDYLDMSDDEDSGPESSDSHDDDISIVAKSSDSSITQKKIFRKKKNNDDELITDFDKEMESELCDTIHSMEFMKKLSRAEKSPKNKVVATTTSSQQSGDDMVISEEVHDSVGDPQSLSAFKNGSKCEQYADIYFDSDEEAEKKNSGKYLNDDHPVLSNDELFYDPDMDQRDQIWMDARREKPHMFPSSRKIRDKLFEKKTVSSNNTLGKNMKRKKTQTSKNRRAPKSDAILDCPACMTTICIDCQKHATFPNQYRAMFVMNCTIDFTERFRYPQSTGKKKKYKVDFSDGDNNKIPLSDEKDDLYYSVKCDECHTHVAMYDKDEVYHFFNVISSYG